MNNYYTLIYLIREWKETLTGSVFNCALSTRRNLLELHFEKKDSPVRLIFSSNSQNAALFTDRYQIPKRQNTAAFFDDLHGDRLLEINLADSDRYVQFLFESGSELVFLLYSNHANALLVREGRIAEAFKRNKNLNGSHAPKPVPVSRQRPSEIRRINDVISVVDPLLPRNLVRAVTGDIDVTENPEIAISKVDLLKRSIAQQAIPHYSDEFGFSIVNPKILGLKDVKRFSSVNEAIAFSFFKWVKFQDFETRKKSVIDRIQKSISRTNIAVSELSTGGNVDDKVALYEKYGHILMASPNADPASGIVEASDYFEGGTAIKIKVDPTRSIVENAQKYYQKSQSIRKAAETYAKRLVDFKSKLNQLEALLFEIQEIKFGRDLEKWLKSNDNVLKRIGYSESDSIQSAQHFRSYSIGNYEVRVGKSATSNDELLRISKKDDIWMHARGVAGSHVVIPLNKSQQMPPPNVLEYAAGLAAFFSKAKGSSLVPVIFTRKKFVRKSKGMAPGAVLVDKEEVLMVPPLKPDGLNADD